MTYEQINYNRADGNIKFPIEYTQDNHDITLLSSNSDRLDASKCVCPRRVRLLLTGPASPHNPFIDINHDSSSFQVTQVSD
jgi:hypothetical protein